MANINILTTLNNALQADGNTRNQAEAALNELMQTPQAYVTLMTQALANKDASMHVRNLAGLQVKNYLQVRNDVDQNSKANAWKSFPEEARTSIKNSLWATLNVENEQVRRAVGMALSKIAVLEVPLSLCPELFPNLVHGIDSDNSTLKLAGLETVGYLLEELNPEHVNSETVTSLLYAIGNHMNKDAHPLIQLAACTAMLAMIPFCADNFDNLNDRNAIFQCCLVMATESSEWQVRQFGYTCFAKIVEEYYTLLGPYMTILYEKSILTINSDQAEVGMQALEFWCEIAEVESSLRYNSEDGDRENTNNKFCENALKQLAPTLFGAMCRQDPDAEDDEDWNISSAAAVCLKLVAEAVGDPIVAYAMPFITANLGDNTDWRKRYAAILAFGNIIEGPQADTLKSHAFEAIPYFLNLLPSDPKMLVRETAAWSIGEISKHFMCYLSPDYWNQLMNALLTALPTCQNNTTLASKICYALHSVAHAAADFESNDPNTNILSKLFDPIVQQLLQTSIGCGTSQDTEILRLACYEAMSEFVVNSAPDKHASVVLVLNSIMEMLKNSLESFESGKDPAELRLQSKMVGLLVYLFPKCPTEVATGRDFVFQICLKLLEKNKFVIEDTFVLIGNLATFLGHGFEEYLKHFVPYYRNAMQLYTEASTITAGIRLTTDFCEAFGSGLIPIADDVMSLLMVILGRDEVDKEVKPEAITAIGDVAMAIGGNFVKYIPSVFPLLVGASNVKVALCNNELIDYQNNLYLSIIETFCNCLHALNDAKQLSMVEPYIQHIFSFISAVDEFKAYRDEEVLRGCVGLIGDMANLIGQFIKPQLSDIVIFNMVNECKISTKDPQSRETALWVESTCSKLLR